MAALRDEGLTDAIGVAPGPANGFTLDILACLERFGDRIDWAMLILGPLEPWPSGLVLPACEQHEVRVLARVVDYGGIFWGDLRTDTPMGTTTTGASARTAGSSAACPSSTRSRRSARGTA